MALTLQRSSFRALYTITRKYCQEKSVYQRHEEGAKPRTVYGKEYPEWRKPWIKREGEWKSKLSVFIEKNPSPDILNALSQVPDLSFLKIKTWWKDMKELQEIHNQLYLPKRVVTLGSNLAALHFFAFRNASVRLKDSPVWIKGHITELNLPNTFVEGYYIEAIDCSEMSHNGIRYEGLENLLNLNFLKWLCLKNSKYIDAWCLDRIAGQNGKSLEYLDISSSDLCLGCILAIARMPALKYLIIKDPGDNLEVQTALSLLESHRKELFIKAVDSM